MMIRRIVKPPISKHVFFYTFLLIFWMLNTILSRFCYHMTVESIRDMCAYVYDVKYEAYLRLSDMERTDCELKCVCVIFCDFVFLDSREMRRRKKKC